VAEGLPRLSLPATLVLVRGVLEALVPGASGPAAAEIPATLRLLDGVLGEVMDSEARLASVAETLIGLSSLDFAQRCEIRGDGSVLDGVSAGVNMLGEELETFVEARGRIERELEDRVAERTLELTRANLALHAEIAERRRVEGELSMAHKLEAVGRLASGVAHEINTPVQFVSDSVQFVQSAFTDLSQVVDQLRAVNHAVVDDAPSREAAAAALAAARPRSSTTCWSRRRSRSAARSRAWPTSRRSCGR
jgi:signal transduction histidine kinase